MFSSYVIVIFSCLFGQIYSQERKVSIFLNPECQDLCNNSTFLVHVVGESENDTLHHIWDFTKKPTFLSALTPRNANLTINWEQFLQEGKKGTVSFSPMPSYMFSLIFDKIIEFNDFNDTGEYNEDEGNLKIMKTENFNWTLIAIDHDPKDKYASMRVEGKSISSGTSEGTVTFLIKAFGRKDHGNMLPHLFHTTNASQITVSLDDFPTEHESSRYAMNLIAASTGPENSTMTMFKHKTVNDEHSPGIFKIAELTAGDPERGSLGGYIQWRTVAYTSSDRVMTNSTEIHDYPVNHSSFNETSRTVVYAVYGDLENIAVNTFNVSFGSPEDGFYRKTKFISWTLLSGLGHPAEEEFSLLVILVLAIGLGLPILLILFGLICLFWRRISKNTDELFLSH